MKTAGALLVACMVVVSVAGSSDPDWPQWQGPDRTAVSKETGLLKQWPAKGPSVAWSISNLGEGYGTGSMQGDKMFIQGTRAKETVVFCLNRADGKPVWTTTLGLRLDQDRGNGPRGTPTIDGDRVYALSEGGDLSCLRVKDGTALWRINILESFKGSNPHWHISESPLVDGNKLIVTPGGRGAGIVALDKMTGNTIWKSEELSDAAGYSSCIAADIFGTRAYMTITHSNAVGVRASDGKLLWKYAPVANGTANVATPIFFNNKVFYTTAYGTGCALLDIQNAGNELRAKEIYFSRDMMNHHGGVVLLNGYLYGFSNAILTCMEFATGKKMWVDRSVGKGAVTFADGHLYLMGEGNVVGLAEATPEGYREKGRFQIEDQGWPSWAHPVVCGGKLYIRNQKMLTAYDIQAR